MSQKDIQLRSRLDTFSSEDSNILGKAIKLVLNSRNPKLLNVTVLAC